MKPPNTAIKLQLLKLHLQQQLLLLLLLLLIIIIIQYYSN